MISRILEKSLKETTLVGVRTTSLNWDEVIVGFVKSIDDFYVTIKEIDKYGMFIGNTTLSIDSIVHIEYNDDYQNRLYFIHKNNSNFHVEKRITIWKKDKELISCFKLIKGKKNITTFYLEEDDSYVTGKIIDFDEKYLLIQNIGSNGSDDGYSCYSVKDIIGIRYDSIEEQKIELLYNNRDKLSLLGGETSESAIIPH